MSTRYVWEKYSVKTSSEVEVNYEHSLYYTNAGTIRNWYCGDEYKILLADDRNNVLSEPCFQLLVLENIDFFYGGQIKDKYIVADLPINFYVIHSPEYTSANLLLNVEIYEGYCPSSSNAVEFFLGENNSLSYRPLNTGSTNMGRWNRLTLKEVNKITSKGDFISYISSSSSSAYPKDGISGNYWYVYKGSDSIDVTSVKVEFPYGQEPGDTCRWVISHNNAVYNYNNTSKKVLNTYRVEYSLNGGSYVVLYSNQDYNDGDIVGLYELPSNAKTIQFRVKAQDNIGYQQSSYVYSSLYTLSTSKIYVGTSNIARKASKIYVGVNGIARKVEKGYIGVNGVARRFL